MVFFGALGGFYDIMTTESNPLGTAPGYMPILEYQWYGSAGTCKPSGCNVIAFYENLRKFPGGLSKRGLANRIKGPIRGQNRVKRQKAKQKPKKNKK